MTLSYFQYSHHMRAPETDKTAAGGTHYNLNIAN